VETEDIRRGIDFASRIGETAKPLRRPFKWWEGGRLGNRTLLFLGIVWVLNLIIIHPIFWKDLTSAYASSSYLLLISSFFENFLKIPQNIFFTIITFFSLGFAPISLYLFVRKIAMRNEVTAFIAALIYILPNPFLGNIPVLLDSVMKGDGAHAMMLSFIPLFLLYVQTFLATGVPVIFLMCTMGVATIFIISPFSGLNLLIFIFVLVLAEALQGNSRVKTARAIFLLISGVVLSFYWYYPSVVVGFFSQKHVQSSIDSIVNFLPILIPFVPLVGVLAFLIFDRREKLRSIFVSLTLFLIYLFLFWIVSGLGVAGEFAAERYLPEVILSISFFIATNIIAVIEIGFNRLLAKKYGKSLSYAVFYSVAFIGLALVVITEFQGVNVTHQYIQNGGFFNYFNKAAELRAGLVDFGDISSIFATIVSVVFFVYLLHLVKNYPANFNRAGLSIKEPELQQG